MEEITILKLLMVLIGFLLSIVCFFLKGLLSEFGLMRKSIEQLHSDFRVSDAQRSNDKEKIIECTKWIEELRDRTHELASKMVTMETVELYVESKIGK